MENTQLITQPPVFPDPENAISLKDFAKVDCTIDELPNGKVKALKTCENCGDDYFEYEDDVLNLCPDCEEQEIFNMKFG